MKKKYILAVSSLLMFFSIDAQTKNNELTKEEKNSIYEELRPKPRSWDQLNELMFPFIDGTKINEVIDCSFIHENSKPISNINQNILYQDYSWNIYKSDYGSTCIELIKPKVGFLSVDQSKVLLLTSKGVGFEELGLWEEVEIYNDFIKSISPVCEANSEVDNIPRIDTQDLIYTDLLSPKIELTDEEIELTQKYILSEEELSEKSKSQRTTKSQNYEYGENLYLNKDNCYRPFNNKKSSFNKTTNVEPGIIGNDDRFIYPDNNLSYMVYLENMAQKPRGSRECSASGTGFYLNSHTIVTAAHIVYFKGCRVTEFKALMVNPFTIAEYDFRISAPKLRKLHISDSWRDLNLSSRYIYVKEDVNEDYAVLKTDFDNFLPIFPQYTIDYDVLKNRYQKHTSGLAVGYPASDNSDFLKFGFMYKWLCGTASLNEYCGNTSMLNYGNSSLFGVIAHTFDQTVGQSGGPFLINHSKFETTTVAIIWSAYVTGILTVRAGANNFATLLTPTLDGWLFELPPNVGVEIDIINYDTKLWEQIDDSTFLGEYIAKGRSSSNDDIESNLYWESDLNGVFGTGTSVSALDAKSILRAGEHVISLEIDTPEYQGYDTVILTIVGPEGSFNIESEYCIINLSQSSKNCTIPVSWQTAISPNTIVYNNRSNTIFATGPQGINIPFTATKNEETELVLYASTDKIYDIDRVTLSARLPTGILSNTSPQCSLEPSPLDPHNGQYRNPKATPPGCGTELSWSNVQWASPSIFYKQVGLNTWVHLYQIECKLNGQVCNGSINTDDFIPELISETGTEFKLLQFQNASSGVLSPTFNVSGHRIADIYEYDNGRHDDFDFAQNASLPIDFEFNYALTTEALLDMPQPQG